MIGKNWHTTVAFGFISLTIVNNSWAQDLLETWHIALRQDPSYIASIFATEAEQESVPQARAKLLPYITANASLQADNKRTASSLSNSNTNRRGLWNLNLSQPIIDINAWNNLQKAQYISQLADVNLVNSRQELILRVSQSYFNVLIAQDTLKALRAEKNAVQEQLKAAEQSFELGSTTITDAHEARSRLDLIIAREHQAVNAVQMAKDNLASIIGQPPEELSELSKDAILPYPKPNDVNPWVQQAQASNLNVAQATLQLKIAEKQLDVNKSGHYPSLRLEAQTGSATDRGMMGQKPNAGRRSLDSTVGVTLSVPIFAGGEISSKVREQSSRKQQSRAELEAAKRLAQQKAQNYFFNVTSGLSRVASLENAAKSSQAALQANQLAYEVGVRINIDVLNAQQQLFTTQNQLSSARYETLLNSLQLKATSGTLTELDLIEINNLLGTN